MKKFISKLFIFLILILVIHILLAMLADGSTDNYYQKFSSPKKNSMIFGTSRAFQGIMPSVIDSILGYKESKKKMYNFAFTITSSPYGEVYYNAINKKLLDDSERGLFIVTVDPWSLSIGKNVLSLENPDTNSVLNETRQFNSSPNFEYLIKKYNKGWGNIALKRVESFFLKKYEKKLNNITGSWTYVNDDGWLDVSTSMDSAFVQKKIRSKAKKYMELSLQKIFSNYRFNFLIRTIELLKQHGDVYLVRLPIHTSLLEIENQFMPNFSLKIDKAINMCSGYYDMNTLNSDFKYIDGNHLHKESGKIVSQLIAEWIIANKENARTHNNTYKK